MELKVRGGEDVADLNTVTAALFHHYSLALVLAKVQFGVGGTDILVDLKKRKTVGLRTGLV